MRRRRRFARLRKEAEIQGWIKKTALRIAVWSIGEDDTKLERKIRLGLRTAFEKGRDESVPKHS